MTHPDTLTIPRAVVEQALEDTRKTAREVFKDSCNHTKDAIEFFAAEFGVQIRAAQPAVVHPIGGRPLESDYVKLTSYIEALEQYVDKKEVLWKAYEDVDCDEYDKLRKAALQPQADTSVLQAAPWPPSGDTQTEPVTLGGGHPYDHNGVHTATLKALSIMLRKADGPVTFLDRKLPIADAIDVLLKSKATPPATQAAELVNEWTMIAPDGTRFTGPTPLKAAMPASKYRLEIDPVAAERFMAVVEQERQAGERENLECMAKYGTLDCPYCGGSGHIGDVMSVGGIVACSYPSCGCTGEGEPCRAEAQNDQLLSTPPATQAALTAALDYLWVVVEHNRLHFGDSHNTVIQGQAVIAQIEALKGPTP